MRRSIIPLVLVILTTPAFAADELKTDDQKTLYTLGQLVARSIAVFQLSPTELELVKQGLTDAATGKSPAVEAGAYTEKVQDLARTRRKALGEKQAAAGKTFLEKASKEKDAQKTPSGMVYIPLKEGTGTGPTASDTVKVNYRGTLVDGKEFDSSFKRGTPAEFRLDGVIKCWTEGVQKMKPGGKARLVCPPDLAYGENGAGEMILPGSTLVFDVDLLEVKK